MDKDMISLIEIMVDYAAKPIPNADMVARGEIDKEKVAEDIREIDSRLRHTLFVLCRFRERIGYREEEEKRKLNKKISE